MKSQVAELKKGFNPKALLKLIINPYEAYKENEETLKDTKKCLIFSGIIIGFSTIIKLITAMYNAIHVVQPSWLKSETTTTWVWENLKNVDYLGTIGSGILTLAVVFAAISGIYYLGSLIVKKETSFMKMLGIVNVVSVPYIISSLIVAPILGLLHVYLSIAVGIVATILTVVTFAVLVNEEIAIEDSKKKIYFHVTIISILVALALIASMIMISSAVSGAINSTGLNSLSSLLK